MPGSYDENPGDFALEHADLGPDRDTLAPFIDTAFLNRDGRLVVVVNDMAQAQTRKFAVGGSQVSLTLLAGSFAGRCCPAAPPWHLLRRGHFMRVQRVG